MPLGPVYNPVPCNSSTCFDRTGNLGLLLFCTLVHALKGDVSKREIERERDRQTEREERGRERERERVNSSMAARPEWAQMAAERERESARDRKRCVTAVTKYSLTVNERLCAMNDVINYELC